MSAGILKYKNKKAKYRKFAGGGVTFHQGPTMYDKSKDPDYLAAQNLKNSEAKAAAKGATSQAKQDAARAKADIAEQKLIKSSFLKSDQIDGEGVKSTRDAATTVIANATSSYNAKVTEHGSKWAVSKEGIAELERTKAVIAQATGIYHDVSAARKRSFEGIDNASKGKLNIYRGNIRVVDNATGKSMWVNPSTLLKGEKMDNGDPKYSTLSIQDSFTYHDKETPDKGTIYEQFRQTQSGKDFFKNNIQQYTSKAENDVNVAYIGDNKIPLNEIAVGIDSYRKTGKITTTSNSDNLTNAFESAWKTVASNTSAIDYLDSVIYTNGAATERLMSAIEVDRKNGTGDTEYRKVLQKERGALVMEYTMLGEFNKSASSNSASRKAPPAIAKKDEEVANFYGTGKKPDVEVMAKTFGNMLVTAQEAENGDVKDVLTNNYEANSMNLSATRIKQQQAKSAGKVDKSLPATLNNLPTKDAEALKVQNTTSLMGGDLATLFNMPNGAFADNAIITNPDDLASLDLPVWPNTGGKIMGKYNDFLLDYDKAYQEEVKARSSKTAGKDGNYSVVPIEKAILQKLADKDPEYNAMISAWKGGGNIIGTSRKVSSTITVQMPIDKYEAYIASLQQTDQSQQTLAQRDPSLQLIQRIDDGEHEAEMKKYYAVTQKERHGDDWYEVWDGDYGSGYGSRDSDFAVVTIPVYIGMQDYGTVATRAGSGVDAENYQHSKYANRSLDQLYKDTKERNK